MAEETVFDPRRILVALEHGRVNFVLIGSLARVLQGTDEFARGVDICPQRRPENVERLREALVRLNARPASGRHVDVARVADGEPLTLATDFGPLGVVPVPAGTRGGWDDLRRASGREALGDGLRVSVASLNDLARMEAALGRATHAHVVAQLRGLQELERTLGHGLER